MNESEELRKAKAECDQFEEGYKSRTKQLDKTLEHLNAVKGENEILRRGIKGTYDLDAWIDWVYEAKALRSEVERLKHYVKEAGWQEARAEKAEIQVKNLRRMLLESGEAALKADAENKRLRLDHLALDNE